MVGQFERSHYDKNVNTTLTSHEIVHLVMNSNTFVYPLLMDNEFIKCTFILTNTYEITQKSNELTVRKDLITARLVLLLKRSTFFTIKRWVKRFWVEIFLELCCL